MVNVLYNYMKVLALFVATLSPAWAEQDKALTIFAAASLGEVLQASTQTWPDPVRISVGGSGTIARQVDQGAPADVVLLANTDWMDWLESRGLLVKGTRQTPFGNKLVLVGPANAAALPALDEASLLERLGPTGRLAMGDHRAVPAGSYAKEWLISKGLWATLHPKLAEVENVRAALALVARHEVPLAILYASDLKAAGDRVVKVWDIPDSEQPEITYSLAAVTHKGQAFVTHLSHPDMAELFRSFGFVTRSP